MSTAAEDLNPAQTGVSDRPTLPGERIWGFWTFTSVNIGLAIATWAFLTGGTIALFVGVKEAIAAGIIGNVIGVALVSVGTCLPAQKYGLEQYTTLRTVFGKTGARVLVLALFVVASGGWNAVLAIMCARALNNVLAETAGTTWGPDSPQIIVLAIVVIVIAWVLLVLGPVSIEWVNKIVAPALMLTTIGMFVLLLTDTSWSELTSIKPLQPFGDPGLDWMIAIELGLGTGFSWWTIMGNLARLTKTPRAALWPNLIGLFAASLIASIVGIGAALALGDADPTVWMVPLGGVWLGVVALLFIAAANITSMVSQTYSGGLAIRQAGGAVTERMPWWLIGALLLVPAALVCFWPTALYDNFFKFVAWVGLVISPLCAVYLVDYMILRRQTLSVRDLYLPEGVSRYTYWAGVNPVGFVAVALGALTYYLILDPLTFESAGIFRYTSASLPAFVVAGVAYWLGTRLISIPLGKGGYRDTGTADLTTGERR